METKIEQKQVSLFKANGKWYASEQDAADSIKYQMKLGTMEEVKRIVEKYLDEELKVSIYTPNGEWLGKLLIYKPEVLLTLLEKITPVVLEAKKLPDYAPTPLTSERSPQGNSLEAQNGLAKD